MAPDSNAGTATTSTSVKTASRPANTTPDIPLAESTSLVRHTLTSIVSVMLWHVFVNLCHSSSPQLGQSPAFCGRSGKQLKKHHSSQRGMLIDDWSRAVKSINVSSSVNQASRLLDGSDQCWQSSGSQGKVGDWIAHPNKPDDSLFSLALLKRNAAPDRICHSFLYSTGFVSSSSQTFLCTGWRWLWIQQIAATCPHWWWCRVITFDDVLLFKSAPAWVIMFALQLVPLV